VSDVHSNALYPESNRGTLPLRVNASAVFISRVISLISIATAILIWRRPDQALNPALWLEESQVLLSYAQCGACALWRTINGHILLVPKLLLIASFKLSINNAPVIAYVLAMAVICATVICIAEAPTHLKAKYLCAMATLLIPTGPENYAVALYTFWWAGLLVILALLWDTGRGYRTLRLVLLIVGGLSSPIMILMGPLFVVRALVERTRSEAGVAALACCLSTVSFTAASSFLNTDNVSQFSAEWVTAGIAKFFGLYTIFGTISSVVSGCLLLILLAFLIAVSRPQMNRYFGILLCALVLSIVSSIGRAAMIGGRAAMIGTSIDALGPFGSGQRYFFYPYIILSFVLLWLSAVIRPWKLQLVPSLVLVSALLLSLCTLVGFVWPANLWGAPPVDWRSELADCASTSKSKFTIRNWEAYPLLDGNQCRSLLEDSLVK
jgi:hypothetical protein